MKNYGYLKKETASEIKSITFVISIRSKDKPFIYRSNSIDALIRIVDTKGGMTILPELSTLSLSEKQEEYLKSIDGTPKAREIGLITTKKPGKWRFIEKLQEHIFSNIPKSMLTAEGIEVVHPEVTTGHI